MTSAERNRGRPRKGDEQDTDTLLEAALTSFAEHGFDKTPLRLIATRAGVDVALISYRYGSKFGLWEAVVRSVSDDSRLQAAEFMRQAEDLPQEHRLPFISTHLVDLIFQLPAFSRVLLTELISNVSDDRKELITEALLKPMHQTILVSLQKMGLVADMEGEPDSGLSLMFAIGSVALISSISTVAAALTNLEDDGPQFREDLAKLLCRILRQQ
ncbi:TetR family transcriptional regulator [Rhizobium sp. AG855]|uniref:TetR/AcrR family transcriptional regulator n=1 Tax=Rhizobium sp. AG855 TaxID=2183898 RepID=UPI000E71A68F|nr:TetR family transcriptional regulator [Rhizobium sp. AG855]RKE77536.1 TetR family transcriptional regulator [Rhizobium sp. AG855]